MVNYNVSKLLTSAIELKDISQRKMASDLGINYTTFNNYVNGNREPDFQTLVAILQYLQFDLNKVFQVVVNDREYSLTKDEMHLLKLYRTLSIQDQKRLLGVNENIVNMLKED